MSQEDPPDLVAHGGDDRPTPLTRLFRDRRVVPLVLVLGYVALAASVISEWQVAALADPYFGGGDSEPSVIGAGGLGGWGTAYLCGLFLLVAAVTVTVFGPAPGRATGRLVTLAVGGAMLVVLAAIFDTLGTTSFSARNSFIVLAPEQAEMSLVRGRGVYCAAVGTVLLVLAAWLTRTGTWTPRPAEQPDEEELDAPIDLSVGPADAFRPGADARDTAAPGDPRWHIG